MKIGRFWGRFKKYILGSKKRMLLATVLLLVVVFVGYRLFAGSSEETRYVVAEVENGTIIQTVTGSGQVLASHQIDLTAKASCQVTAVYAKTGDRVKSGQLIAKLDSREAEIALENAQISYDKLVQPTDALTLLQSQNSLQEAKESKVRAENSLVDSYNGAFDSLSSAFLDMPDVLDGLDTTLNMREGFLYESDLFGISSNARESRELASKSYYEAIESYRKSFNLYKTVNRDSATSSLENLLTEAIKTAELVSKAVKDTKNAVDVVYIELSDSRQAEVGTTKTDIASWTSTANNNLSSLSSAQDEITNGQEDIVSLSRQLREKEESLADLQNGPDLLDLRSQELSLRQKRYDYEDYFIRAPFDGVVAQLDIKPADNVSGSVGVLITDKKVAEIYLNEVDITKVEIGQKATLTFDALEDFAITGEVTTVDQIATVSQGVVSYNVKIAVDTDDARIKPGMSVSASIATGVAKDILTVPVSAVKEQDGLSVVEVVSSETVINSQGVTLTDGPINQTVETGLTDDVSVEIKSGLTAGDKVIVRTITTSNSSSGSSTQTPSLFGGGGGGMRMR